MFSLGLISKTQGCCMFYIERDGVDVACSYIQTGLYSNVLDAAIRWKNSRRAWQKFKRTLPLGSFVEVSFKDLVESPDKTIDRVFDSLKIPKRIVKIADIKSLLGDVGRL